MADQQHPTTQDPPIYKLLSPKTQGYLRATATQREEAARLNADTMSNEQTYVILLKQSNGGEANHYVAASLQSSLTASRFATDPPHFF